MRTHETMEVLMNAQQPLAGGTEPINGCGHAAMRFDVPQGVFLVDMLNAVEI